AHIEHDCSDATAHGHLRPHAVGPEAVDLAILECSGRRETEVDALTRRARNRRDLHAIPIEIEAGLDEKPTEPHVDPRCRSDTAALDHLQVPSPGLQVLMHDEKPVHA